MSCCVGIFLPQKIRASPYPEYRHRNTASVINKAKKGQRSSLSLDDWVVSNYAFSNCLTRLGCLEPDCNRIVSVDRSDITPETFYRDYLAKGIPVIVRGGLNDWPAIKSGLWSTERLQKRFKHSMFKIGEEDNGRKIRAKFKYFNDYMKNNQDDSPLYLFESGFDFAPEMAGLLDDFSIPDVFPHDYLNLCGKENKPPSRWFCIGPKRSGTTVHKDPLGTNAWNAVTSGLKRWVVIDPTIPRSLARGTKYRKKGEGTEAIDYFDLLLPRIKSENPGIHLLEGLQGPGDLIFVPGGWWHGVVNLEDSIAVTQNYCGPENFDFVYTRMTRDRPGLCMRWERNCKRWAPALYKRMKYLRTRHEELFPHGETSSDSSSSDSEYSSSDSSCDIDWQGLP